MTTKIEQVAIQWLDTGRVETGFSISELENRSQKGYMQWVGKLIVSDSDASYLVEYESLTPLHGSGVDDINTVTSITAMV